MVDRWSWKAVAGALALTAGIAGGVSAQGICGSAVLGERAQPAVFQGITLGPQTVSRLWRPGHAAQEALAGPCGTGCLSFSASPLCDGGGDCTAVTGIEWLNATCATEGFLPAASVLLLETPTADDGGRWAAIRVDHNAGDANFDLDAAAAAICGPSCATLARPYAGGGAQGIEVVSASEAGGTLTLKLWWMAPAPSGQALNSGGEDLISSYSLWVARSSGGTPPVMTGGKAGWSRIDDIDGSRVGGYSTDTKATVNVALGGSNEAVYVALGINFDGTGNPDSDANTVASSFISRGIEVWKPGSAAPLVTAVVPGEGPVSGGTRLVISGVGLAGATAVTVGGNPATDLRLVSGNRLTALVPAGVAGAVDVAVTTGSGTAVLPAGFRYEEMEAAGLAVDGTTPSGGSSNLNGVLEPGERVVIAPSWKNGSSGPVDLSGHAGGLVGPAGAEEWMRDTEGIYGTIGVGEQAACTDGSVDCYEVKLENPATRPASHWDLTYEEVLSTGRRRVWTVHVGQSFADVTMSHWAYSYVETLLHNGITTGCGGGSYCPADTVTRAQMAAFLVRAVAGRGYVPPPCSQPPFDDVPCWRWFAPWVRDLKHLGITTGCHDNDYCPFDPVTRGQMAKFLLKAKWGGDYEPPPCTQPPFDDVPCWRWFAPWVAELKAEGITTGCGGGNYCPFDPVKRAQMAAFLTRTFDLRLNGD